MAQIIAILLTVLTASSASAQMCNLSFLAKGMSSTEFIAIAPAICKFLEKANEKLRKATGNPDAEVRILSSGDLIDFKSEGIDNYMVAGGSAELKPEEAARGRDILAEFNSGLASFNPEKTAFFPGGTATGTVGSFHEVGVRRGFRVVGVTSLAALEYEPALMTDVYFEFKKGFGAESEAAVNFAKGILVFGGGKQTARESIKTVFAQDKPAIIIANDTFGGKSEEIAEILQGFDKVKVFPSFAAAATDLTSTNEEILARLPRGALPLSSVDLRHIYKGMTLLGFSTWAENSPTEQAPEEFRRMVIKLFDSLDRTRIAIVVAGTELGGEKIVIEEALKRGFEVIGTPAEEAKPELLSPKIRKWVQAGKTWGTRNQTFVHIADAMITAGQSRTILNHVESASQAKKPVFQLKGLSRVIDGFANNLDSSILFTEPEVSRIIETIETKTGRRIQIRSCRSLLSR